MIAVQLQGGLGNQLFQYATARALAYESRQIPYLDTSLLLDKAAHRPYYLSAFPIRATVSTNRLRRWFFHRFQKPLLQIIDESDQPIPIPADRIYLKGYWQNPSYFNAIKPMLQQEISLPVPLHASLDKIENRLRVGVHVRRGDFAGHSLHEVCDADYYLKAMDAIRHTIDGCKFFVFSDDIAFCKAIFSGLDNIVFVEETDTVRSFLLLKSCTHFVLSNSSFSWWAQYLRNEPGMVIAPIFWLRNKPTLEMPLYQPHWKLI